MRDDMRLFPSYPSPLPARLSGFTLIEMLTTVAILVIVLGLMVSLARDVRNRSAERVTKDMLARLDRMMAQYYDRNAQQLPIVTPLISPAVMGEDGKPLATTEPADDAALLRAAKANNADFSRALRPHATLDDANPSYFDAWGNPVVFMPRQHPAIG